MAESPDDRSKDLGARRQSDLRASWAQNADFSDRRRMQFDTQPLYSDALRQIGQLTGLTRIVEIGCGNGDFAAHLSAQYPAIPLVASDLEGPRLERARAEHSGLSFESGDALAMLERHQEPGVLFVAMNVFGNLSPDEIDALFTGFSAPGAALTFLAGGLPPDRPERSAERRVGWNHNFVDLLRRSRLVVRHCRIEYAANPEGRAAYVVTAATPQDR
ncbi:class I SAM-dependent methyltransferase [Brevundimonas lutea]|uniref:class I SAM-dependent methyltransferase n=1 Tax=Brevundimonas lutea TaxID=2293980 RepID=UPI000F02F370|nr:class I SAM-dependent methyltransferase [Brevundimonas lutea]